ncbi:hypothetical protein [Streptomyces graminilatus]|uniref:hypothetical protein n=1 Tax=Streptomyces graminilatus TaxID=1464070 RepID=UPI0006E1DB1E|nr:hypothetical protein [Streptomyces graminilatus]
MFSHSRASSVLATAMDIAYAGGEEMAITVHAPTGSSFTVVSLTGNDVRPRRTEERNVPVDFDPFDLTALVGYLSVC